MPMTVLVTVRGLDQWIAYIEQFDRRLANERHKGLFKSVNRIADVWLDNFQSEGKRVGGWDGLKPMTQDIRAGLNFSPDHPILERDGALKDVAVSYFTRVSQNGGLSKSDSYSAHATTAFAAVNNQRALIEATGWKVANQYRTTGKYGHPARQIWFVDKNVRWAARSGLVDWLVNDVMEP